MLITIILQTRTEMLKLMYITNRPEIVRIAEEAGVDRIFVDLETIGKQERQRGMDSVQSHHTLEDIRKVRAAFGGELLVRSNPIYPGSPEEIETIIANGADVVMLPYFKTVNEAAKFIDLVGGRAKINLLVETAEAVEKIDAILALEGIDEVHIGLNDLHLAYGMKFMFELLANGTVEFLGRKILGKGLKFGFGGIARLGYGMLPAERVIREHYRLGSTCAILSRSFCNADKMRNLAEIRTLFLSEMRKIRELEKEAQAHVGYFSENIGMVRTAVESIVNEESCRL